MIYLKKLNKADAKKEFDFLVKLKPENGFENEYYNMSYNEFLNTSIQERLNSSNSINLKKGYVPDTYFFLYDNEQIVGIFKVRHHLNDHLKNGAGHIGYAIAEDFRNRGYAVKGLNLAIQELHKLMPKEEQQIYLSCKRSNIASLKVQEACGAYIDHIDGDEFYTRIDL